MGLPGPLMRLTVASLPAYPCRGGYNGGLFDGNGAEIRDPVTLLFPAPNVVDPVTYIIPSTVAPPAIDKSPYTTIAA